MLRKIKRDTLLTQTNYRELITIEEVKIQNNYAFYMKGLLKNIYIYIYIYLPWKIECYWYFLKHST
jgi:hypothetical protein